MDLEYDRKFEEMKKYIPFLESMIKRLESTNSGGSNPRKAQLDKIRSLRYLLLDKKKRMKMENLLKCEQVLINLYAKVEQRDSMAETIKEFTKETGNEKSDLNTVRNKLKSVVLKLNEDLPDTLPEIARPTNTEVDCTPGSKEPALFQRRPNKASHSPPRNSQSRRSDDDLSTSKRHYTRVLMSPEPKKSDWPAKNDTNTEKPLYSRRSPRSPRRHSPSYKRERKKFSKQRSKSSQQSKDLNITIKVPEESLNSLDTTDILSRIINCNDNDVDIDTLRGLRSQILGELKQTGTNDDISDLIVKSYKKKRKRSKSKNEEVEEGELSDSESETIENIYGSIVLMNKDEANPTTSKTSHDKEQPRKIQICLVINSDKDNDKNVNDQKSNTYVDFTEFEPFTGEKTLGINKGSLEKTVDKSMQAKSKGNREEGDKNKGEIRKNKSPSKTTQDKQQNFELNETNIKIDNKKVIESTKNNNSDITNMEINKNIDEHSTGNVKNKITNEEIQCNKSTKEKTQYVHEKSKEPFKPNFYQPLAEEKRKIEETTEKENDSKTNDDNKKDKPIPKTNQTTNVEEISPVKNQTKQEAVSEIDILQALKKEILSETVAVPISEAITPPLHQPKVTKVASSQEITSKKRISIENYKQKSVPPVKQPLFASDNQQRVSKDDNSKKQSLKLTEKECERFNFSSSLPANDSSDDDVLSNVSMDEIYGNLAPKSPDHDDFADTGIKPPVIIPSDPVKNVVVSSKMDIDMRTLIGTPGTFCGSSKDMISPLINNENAGMSRNEKGDCNENFGLSAPDVRSRTESNQGLINDKPNSYLMNSDRIPRPEENFQNISSDMPSNVASNILPLMSLNIPPCVPPRLSPNIGTSINPMINAILNPNIPAMLNPNLPINMNAGMTPILNPTMTPSRNPSMTPSRNPGMLTGINQLMNPMLTPNSRSYEMTPSQNFDNDDYSNQKHVYAPIFSAFDSHESLEKESFMQNPWENNENSMRRDNDYQRHRNDRYETDIYNRSDNSPKIRMDCPGTPNPSFGRMETPRTPVHSFGRSDCPMTPSHPYGRSESNLTPSNVFGRGDYNHNMSMNNPKYIKSQDPRFNRNSDYDSYRGRREDRSRSHFKDNYSSEANNKYMRSQDKFYGQVCRSNRERRSRRDSSVSRSSSRDNDGSYKNYHNDYRYSSKKSIDSDDYNRRRNYRAKSTSRTNPNEDSFSSPRESDSRIFPRENVLEKPLSVQSHSGRSFNIDTSFNRTFQETKSSSHQRSFDARRQRATSVGRALLDYPRENTQQNTKESKFIHDVPDRRKSLNYRRACSVGRELKEYNLDKNFKDIKADLRSYIIEDYDLKMRECVEKNKTVKYNTNLTERSNESKSNKFTFDKRNDNIKYSPKKNIRDPRLRRDVDVISVIRDKDKNSNSSGDKKFGIVYSNDNIAKGTILASAAGVRNFKIPKIKRPEEKEYPVINANKINEDHVSKKSIIVKDNKNDTLKTSQVTKRDIEMKKETLIDKDIADKRSDIENTRENSTEITENIENQITLGSCTKKDKEPTQDDILDSVNDTSGNCERRITRSSKKNSVPSVQNNKLSPVKRRRVKRPIMYDSDSDSQCNSTESNKKNLEATVKVIAAEKTIQTEDTDLNEEGNKNSKGENVETSEIKKYKEKTKENKVKDTTKNLRKVTADSKNDEICNKELIEKTIDNSLKETNTIGKNGEDQCSSVTQNESCEGQNYSLDGSFGGDEEFLNDNMTSGSVLDNINALIADLDNDIESPKINEINDKFITNIVESISSNESPIPIEVNERDFAPDNSTDKKLEFKENDVSRSNSEDQITDKVNMNTVEISNSENVATNDKNVTHLESTSDDNIECMQKNSNEIQKKESPSSNNRDVEVGSNEIRTEEISNDAIVSTTANDDNSKAVEISNDSINTLCNTDKASDNGFAPDSTFNLNISGADTNKEKEIVPDSTNELKSEMNCDITSTHNSFEMSKEQPVATSSSTQHASRIDSIGTLLSILEDKNKIKELLSMLSKDSSENEKLVKKLEKISEIVSDDEEDIKIDEKKGSTENAVLGNETHNENKDAFSAYIDKKDNNPDLLLQDNAVLGNEVLKENKGTSSPCVEKKDSLENAVLGIETLKENKGTSSACISEAEIKDSGIILGPKNSASERIVEKIVDQESVSMQVNNIVEEPCKHQHEGKERVENEKEKTYDVEPGKKIDVDKANDGQTDTHKNNINEVETITAAAIAAEETKVQEKENECVETTSQEKKEENKIVKKSKITKKGRSKLAKNVSQNKERRVTRSEATAVLPQNNNVPKKPSRELLKLQEDIREMFISEDIHNSTGIRMCRLAKMVEEKQAKGDTPTNEVEPVVVLEKIKGKIPDENLNSDKTNSKRTPRIKPTLGETPIESKNKEKPKCKPGPKSKTKIHEDDHCEFETESNAESNNTVDSTNRNTDSDSDSASAKSFGSSDLVDIKKKTKRKRRSWKLGVIRTKSGKKKKADVKNVASPFPGGSILKPDMKEEKKILSKKLPDLDCFTDENYCFSKNVHIYSCRLCGYRGKDIVPHIKKQHPHSEIPLSRLNPAIAKKAIEQCDDMNSQALRKIKTNKYICRFCFKEFRRSHTALESFFWHVVSMHTGEYKQLCSECINVTRCPFNLDIPPPPKNPVGQLIGYLCGRCHFTQISLENLKTHVIIRHDDQHTIVYSISLSDMSKKALQSFMTKSNESSVETPRVMRSSGGSNSITEPSDDRSDITGSTDRTGLDITRDSVIAEINSQPTPNIEVLKNKIQTKFSFENDDMSDTSIYSRNDEIIKAGIKLERDEDTQDTPFDNELGDEAPEESVENAEETNEQSETIMPSDVLDYPHFKIKLGSSGTKEYICCINGEDHHYKSALLISFKKHVQTKHSEKWDGYCFVCKVIVTSQGIHHFKDCLKHYLDKHMDNFPVMTETTEPTVSEVSEIEPTAALQNSPKSKSYINVRPLRELIFKSDQSQSQEEDNSSLPKIREVVSLGAATDSFNSESQKQEKLFKYEESQAEVMSKKHRVVLDTMISPEKLIQTFKCAGRFCSYTTDNAEDALVHASTHQKIGGENSLKCAYCDFDALGNAIDLVMHVFKNYSHCSYACSKCFYRASASQLVYAHVKRVHAALDAVKVPILSAATVIKDNSKDDTLSREEAVMYYICNNHDPEEDGVCQFKSFILTKFREHLQTKHPTDQEFPCYICHAKTSSSRLLVEHLKNHGLRIYQCCRCLFGADNENELLAHASLKHPLRKPKAYIRIMTKGNSSEVRVLPLAVLSKTSVQTTVVSPSTEKENPVKQAERSIDLENLIGHTTAMIDSLSTLTTADSEEPPNVLNVGQIEQETERPPSTNAPLNNDPVESPATVRNSPLEINAPVIKKEPEDTIETPRLDENPAMPSKDIFVAPSAELSTAPSEKSLTVQSTELPDPDVVCLDSDEDSSRQNVIDLSKEESTPAESEQANKPKDDMVVKIPRARLYKCSKCFGIQKTEASFKKHLISCFTDTIDVIPCSHCSFSAGWPNIVNHYTFNHMEAAARYMCAVCDGKFVSVVTAKRHMHYMHNERYPIITKNISSCASVEYFKVELSTQPTEQQKERVLPKRKMSSDAGRLSEPPAKLKKYGPQDVDRLPINPILDDLVYCAICEFNTKVRLNMVRHLQLHAEQQPVPRTAPVNPVPHLDTNEKHFDKMVNLASSSIAPRSDKASKDSASITEHLSPEVALLYPKCVPARHRYTCGAKDCSYISVNETMFKFHWETLHNSTNDYHCVHCPPHQHIDTSKPLSAGRIIAHLKMHDLNLYGCSSCSFYHFSRKLVEKHLKDVHGGRVIVIREQGVAPPAPAPVHSTVPAPTMDLKPWQCGLCKFKSMLRPEVIDHCGKLHQSKMQFKCTYCGFRTSNIENISKHQSKQHPGKKEEVFYFYYREGSIPDEADGSARWQKQSQRNASEVKTESDPSPSAVQPTTKGAPKPPIVNLAIVKTEVVEPDRSPPTEESIDDLCKAFGQFCDPNGLKYKCSLCKVVIEDNQEDMQSHLYEELQYRKWRCGLCPYRAFHKPGLQQHVETEHANTRESREPVELQVDTRIETWVAKFLEHQTEIIQRNRENLAMRKVEILMSTAGASAAKVPPRAPPPEPPKVTEKPSKNVTMAELERLFGPFGVPNNLNYSCPKCSVSARSEAVMREHLESELNKIRWCCNICTETFQSYHDAQYHCRSVHPGQSSRPVEATRDPAMRAAWVDAVLRVQKLSMNYMPVTSTAPPESTPQLIEPPQENSLLVVRYEETVPTPEEQMALGRQSDSDDDKLVIDEPEIKAKERLCPWCPAKFKYERFHEKHLLKHYGLKPFTCPYCSYSDSRKALECHLKTNHAGRSIIFKPTPVPKTPLVYDHLKNPPRQVKGDDDCELICLVCEKTVLKAETNSHVHGPSKTELGRRDDMVFKCCICLTLHKTIHTFKTHHKNAHATMQPSYAYYVLHNGNLVIHCSTCNAKFSFLVDLKAHCEAKHGLRSPIAKPSAVIEIDDEDATGDKRKASDDAILPTAKRVAKKSTTKLPKVVAVARKSTTKLPFEVPELEERSHYGTKPNWDNLVNVTTLMPFCNTMVPFPLKKLSEIIKINPTVLVKDINKK